MQIMVMCKSLESPIMENGKLMQTYMQLVCGAKTEFVQF